MKRGRKKKRRIFNKKFFIVLTISLLTIILGFVGVMCISSFFPEFETYEEAEVVEIDKNTGKLNALIVGVDKGGTLTDTIMIASYDLDNNAVNILSVPRDTRMYIGGRYQKINSAHSLKKNGKSKGINGTIEAVTRLTGIPINYYVEFTFSAFRETIDALGGVDFDVPQNMNYDDPYQDLHIHLKKGMQHLDGEKAEQFVRFRRYPRGDIDRVAAQQAFVKALIEQKLNASIVTKIPELFDTLEKNFVTNITAKDVTKYLLDIANLTSDSVKMHAVPGFSNGTDYGSSYWIPNMEELKTLIETVFGYDASKITIHSADGTSVSKDVKSATPSPTKKPVDDDEKEESADKKEDKDKKDNKDDKDKSDKENKDEKDNVEEGDGKIRPAVNPTKEPTEKPESTKEPKPSDKSDSEEDKDSEESEPTEKPTEEPTEKPADEPTMAPAEKPEATKAPESTEKPNQRPAANPVAGEE